MKIPRLFTARGEDVYSLFEYTTRTSMLRNTDGSVVYVCGTMTIEGAPYLRQEHLPDFDCSSKCGKRGLRVNMPATATIAEIGELYRSAWQQMVKAITVYRDGSKLSQPQNSSSYQDLDEVIMHRPARARCIRQKRKGTPVHSARIAARCV